MTVTTMGSSSCPFTVDRTELVRHTLVVVGHDVGRVCTADLGPRRVVASLPEDVRDTDVRSAVVVTTSDFAGPSALWANVSRANDGGS